MPGPAGVLDTPTPMGSDVVGGDRDCGVVGRGVTPRGGGERPSPGLLLRHPG